MPELPEVETIKKQISHHLPLFIKKSYNSKYSSSIIKETYFIPQNTNLTRIERQGKYLIFHLNKNLFILSHLSMSGSWRLLKIKSEIKHSHIQLECINQKKETIFLSYVDPRRFGKIFFLNKLQLESKLSLLGPDITTSNFNKIYLYKILQKNPHKKIKNTLLDQKLFAGIGNYLASEICAHAHIIPYKENYKINLNTCQKIIETTKKLIKQNIRLGGLTFQHGYINSLGEKGNALNSLVVFQQKICKLCHKTQVKKISMNNRSTFFCSKCQK